MLLFPSTISLKLCHLVTHKKSKKYIGILYVKLGPALYFLDPRRALQGDMVFWFIGVDTSIMQNAFWMHFKMLIKSVQNSGVYIWTFYVHIKKLWKKRYCLWPTKKCYVKKNGAPKFIILHGPQKMSFNGKILWMYILIFYEFLDFLIIIFEQWVHLHLWPIVNIRL